ncbi:unnamed protein product [Paramecium primaurelia]|uniref:Nascent polypeptide-associated complex subunit alpha-like UBA domain-containing protein n=2 Tax=Paramecium TaxID=5884 RepID=A0A8S1U8Q6_9CILI|nr:unnamed protein product [Paramecium primaurelia]CAD8161591.1 unnamed protein product [Paramecium pentaurelia]
MNQKIVMRNEDQEVEVSGTEQPVEIQQETIKLNEAHIDLIVKEFDVDRFQATRWLKKNEGDLQKTIKWIISN